MPICAGKTSGKHFIGHHRGRIGSTSVRYNNLDLISDKLVISEYPRIQHREQRRNIGIVGVSDQTLQVKLC
jgi:hypothetical protein